MPLIVKRNNIAGILTAADPPVFQIPQFSELVILIHFELTHYLIFINFAAIVIPCNLHGFSIPNHG